MKKISLLKQPLHTTAVSILIVIICFTIYLLLSSVLGFSNINYIITIPLISGYLHVDPFHFIYNFLSLYLFLLPRINRRYNYQDIYFITLMLSLLYLPLVITGFCEPAVGISGTCFFLLARYLMSLKPYYLGLLLFIGVLFLEYYASEPGDPIAHFVHYFGAILGCISLRRYTIIGITIVPCNKTNKERFLNFLAFLKNIQFYFQTRTSMEY